MGSNISPFDLLEKVDLFYNNAWNKLLTFITIFVIFLGIILPILMQWFQRRMFKVEENKIREGLKDDIRKVKDEISEEIKVTFEYERGKNKKQMETLEKRFQKQANTFRGGLMHVQGGAAFSTGEIVGATYSYMHAIKAAVKADDRLNYQKAMHCLLKRCMPKLKNVHLKKLSNVYDLEFEKFIQDLEKANENNKYTYEITQLRRALSKISSGSKNGKKQDEAK